MHATCVCVAQARSAGKRCGCNEQVQTHGTLHSHRVGAVQEWDRSLTVVEGLGSITEEDSGDCQQAANGNAEAVELSSGQSPKGEQQNDSLEDSPARTPRFDHSSSKSVTDSCTPAQRQDRGRCAADWIQETRAAVETYLNHS